MGKKLYESVLISVERFQKTQDVMSASSVLEWEDILEGEDIYEN